DRLSPVALDRTFYAIGHSQWTAPAVGDRFGDAAVLAVLRNLDPSKLKGTLTVAFVAQQWLGGRGLQRLLFALKPDEVIYVGRLMRAPAPPAGAAAAREPAQGFTQAAGNGVLLASPNPQAEPGALGVELKKLAAQINVAFKTDYSAPLLPRGASVAQLPER